jgi:hypothetical protein
MNVRGLLIRRFLLAIFMIEWPAKMPVAGNFQAGVKGKLLEDIMHVAFYRIHGEIELAGNLFVAESFSNEVYNLPLTARHFDRLERVAFPGARDMFGNLGKKG